MNHVRICFATIRSYHRTIHLSSTLEGMQSVRLSKLIAQCKNMQMSRRSAEKRIREGQVTVSGKLIEDPAYQVDLSTNVPVKVNGRMLVLSHLGETKTNINQQILSPATKTRVWLVHKLKGEIVTDDDPGGRPSLMERIKMGGVGRPSRKAYRNGQTSSLHLKAIGRLDMMTEGLVIVTNDGMYARNMELPVNSFHRTYRVRVHGLVTQSKLAAIRKGVTIDSVHYKGMIVSLDMHRNGLKVKGGATNSWVTVTCYEGKNRQIRKIFQHLGLTVSRLIRISYGDYSLNTIPPGMAIEVPVKDLDSQKRRGAMPVPKRKTTTISESKVYTNKEDDSSKVQWIKQY